ncbi:MAG: beta strand repeat-containing protein [Janthinobacterium lividum]
MSPVRFLKPILLLFFFVFTAFGVSLHSAQAVAPTLSSVSPSSGATGSTVSVTFTGTNFTTATANTVTFTGTTGANTGVTTTFGSANAASATSLTVSAALPSTADTYNVTITNSNGTSNTQLFAVNTPAPPTLTGVTSNPASAVKGSPVALTLTGTGFTTTTADTVTLTGTTGTNSGIVSTFGSANAASATSLTVTAALPSPADTYNVKVTNANGSSGTVAFVVNNPAPAITSLTPGTGVAGTTVANLTIAGTGFLTGAGGSTVQIVSTDGMTTLTPVSVTVNSATKITVASLPLPTAAGNVAITVSNPNPGGSTSNTADFMVTPVPSITRLTPSTGVAGTTVPSVVITGTGFLTGTGGSTVQIVSIDGTTTLPPASVTVISTTQITVTGLTLPATAGTVTVTVTNPGPVISNAANFTVTPPAPTLASVTSSPASAITGTNAVLTLTGTGFTSATVNTITLTGTTGSNSNVVTTFGSAPTTSATSLVLSGVLPVAGAYTVKVTNANGTTAAGVPFTVNPASPPTLTAVTSIPASSIAETSTTLTLTGTGFTAGSANIVTLTGTTGTNTGIVTTFGSAVSSAPGTTLTVSGLLPSADTYNVKVSNANGSSGTVTFVVNNPAPAITNLTPSTGVAGATVASVVITGTGFLTGTGGSTVQIIGPDGTTPLTPAGFTVDSATQITVSGLTLPTTSGTVTVTVTNPNPGGSTSNAADFIINPVPNLTSTNPTTGTQGSAITLTLTGSGFTTGTANTVTFNGSLIFGSAVAESATSLTVTGTLPSTPGTSSITVSNPNGISNSVSFTVGSAGLTLSSVTSNPAAAVTGTAVELTLSGSGFDGTTASNNQVYFTQNFAQANNGTPQFFGPAKTVIGGTQLIVDGILPSPAGSYTVTVQVPDPVHAGLFLTSTSQSFIVNNPIPGIALSNGIASVSGTVTAAPQMSANVGDVLTSLIIPGSAGTGFVNSYIATGASSNIVAGSTVTFTQNGASISAPSLTYAITAASNTLTVTGLPSGFTAAAGPVTVIVHNPGPGGGPSNAGIFFVTNHSPTISSVSVSNTNSTSAPAGTSVTLSISGKNFIIGTTSLVILGTDGLTQLPLTIGTITSTLIPVTVTLPTTPGSITVEVSNPIVDINNASGTASASFTVTAAPLTLSPAFAYVGDPSVVLTITTSGSFLPALPSGDSQTTVTVQAIDSPTSISLQATLLNSSTITAPLPAEDFPVANSYLVTVHQVKIADTSTTFFALPLGPIASGATPNPSVKLTNTAANPQLSITTNAYFSAPSGEALFSVPYDYSDVKILPITPASADVPASPGSSVLAEITASPFSTALTPYSNLAVWNPLTFAYQVTNSTGTLANALVLGQGYWGRFPVPDANAVSVVGLVKRGTDARSLPLGTGPIDAQGRFIIHLHPGWNMIGDPWAETEGQTAVGVLLQNIQVSGTDSANAVFTGSLTNADALGLVSAVFYQYGLDKTVTPNAYDYIPENGFTSGSVIIPYIGYWVHAYGECELLIPQP